MARYSAGRPMNLDPRLPGSVTMVLAGFESAANLPLARELWAAEATESLRKVDIPTLVLIGGTDVQIDAVADGRPLEQAAWGKDNVTFAYPQTANHVFNRPGPAGAPRRAVG